MVAGVAAGLDANATLHAIVPKVSAPSPSRDHEVDLVAFGADPQLLRTDPGQGSHIPAFEFVFSDHEPLRIVDLLGRVRDFHAQNFGAVEQTLGVLLQTKNRGAMDGLVSPHAFECATTVMQCVGKNMDLGVAPFHQVAVHPNLAVTVVHGRRQGAHGIPFGTGESSKSFDFKHRLAVFPRLPLA